MPTFRQKNMSIFSSIFYFIVWLSYRNYNSYWNDGKDDGSYPKGHKEQNYWKDKQIDVEEGVFFYDRY